MGTRAITIVKDLSGDVVLELYRTSDGYQSCHGEQLRDFLCEIRLVNGFSSDDFDPIANGMGCLAAQLVAKFKTKAGLFYIQKSNTDHIDYKYEIYPSGDRADSVIMIRVESYGTVIFDGPVNNYKCGEEDD